MKKIIIIFEKYAKKTVGDAALCRENIFIKILQRAQLAIKPKKSAFNGQMDNSICKRYQTGIRINY